MMENFPSEQYGFLFALVQSTRLVLSCLRLETIYHKSAQKKEKEENNETKNLL